MSAIATFALGCFWGPDEYFSNLPGVTQTVVGYTGGTSSDPDYEHIGDHTEAVQITFDPEKISYEELLEHFWKEHDPTYKSNTQYKSAIFTHDEEQEAAATRSKEREQKKFSPPIATEIVPAAAFHRAEEYHQKFLRKNPHAAC